ncbi:MAG: nucleotidyltransferase domain-containing protein [Coriobacteriia bacterium]|nr:nucleotidyltransferase domain-containing protein [Coriobacteriia bacterium]
MTHPDERFYQTQLIRELGLSSSLVQSELKKLAGIGFVTSTRESNTRYFQANKAFPIYPELKSIVFKTVGLADFLRESLDDIGPVEVALIYGSVAKNLEDMRSDVDLLVIGDVELDVLNEAVDSAERAIGREINPTVYTREEWDGRVKIKQAFVTDILAGSKIFLIGDEDELRRTS